MAYLVSAVHTWPNTLGPFINMDSEVPLLHVRGCLRGLWVCLLQWEFKKNLIFIIKEYWNLSNTLFFASIVLIIEILSFNLSMLYFTFKDLHIVSYSCFLVINSIWFWFKIIFMLCWIRLLIFYWDFCIYIYQEDGSIIFLSCNVPI